MSIFLVFFTAFIWSSSFAISKLAIDSSAPLFVTGSRMILAGVILAGVTYYKERSLRLPRSIYMPIFLLSLSGFYLANVCEFVGLRGLTSSKACFIYGLSPFISALFSYIQLKETITWKKTIGLFLGLFGYISYLFFGGEGGLWTWQIGYSELLLLLATCFSAFGWTLLRKIEKNTTLSVGIINVYAMLIAGILSLLHSMCVENWDPVPVSDSKLFLYSIVGLVVISNLICYNLYAKLLRQFSSTFLSFCSLVMPLFSAFYGWLLLGENFSLSLLLAVSFMVIGCRMIYHEEFRQGYIVS
ncbi:DMT family transporter [Chlamydia ibidis]|nr:DMT family transporter [Chlamydia ibidis]